MLRPKSEGGHLHHRGQVEVISSVERDGRPVFRDLRWGVAESARAATPLGPRLIHDDRLLSAALVAELERRRRDGVLLFGASASRIIPGRDPLS